MAYHGQASEYYNNGPGQYQAPPGPPPSSGYQQYGQTQYDQPQGQPYNQAAYEPKYTQGPPTYGQNFNLPQDAKQDFQQTFVIQKPKFNDLWAGLLVSEHTTVIRQELTRCR